MKPKALTFSGYGLNCEDETKIAFEMAGGEADILHINDLIADPKRLNRYQIAVIPGGFAYGDDTGAGKAYGARVRHHLAGAIEKFLERDTLFAGICNGFQVVTGAHILPGTLVANDFPRYLARWVDLEVVGDSPWLVGIKKFSLPIAHGEGKYVDSEKNLDKLEKEGKVVLKYMKGETSKFFSLPANPNGSLRDIAGIASHNGRVLGLMPHPERATLFTHLPHWTHLRESYRRHGLPLPVVGPGLQVFKNAINYFS
jgi:phosphoribosylformylglycinamidine synthase